MNSLDKLNLDQMIKENDVKDFTKEIRKKKHSNLIKTDLDNMLNIFEKFKSLDNEHLKNILDNLLIEEAPFLYKNYTDIFNKIKNKEMDIDIFNQFLDTLKEIEDNKLDQHEASYKIGKILKELYIDSALKRSEKLDKLHEKKTIEAKEISYKEFKNIKK